MSFLTTVWTHKAIFDQNVLDAAVFYQDFFLVGLPAHHCITNLKITTLENFVADANVSVTAYVGLQGNLGTPDVETGVLSINKTKLFGYANLSPLLNAPETPNSTYNYGSFRWFTLSAPGNYQTTGPYCLPATTNPFDIYVRFVVNLTVGSTPLPLISGITAGSVEISTSYSAI